ncbi:addiction module protein [Cronbergia sp. UHCC 0137]|uniref:addiction module protein n=1 Tax=Cronbergia sp. UHCC 0137 TaxID=3110239 RepID=UPI002B1F7A85|nr:addiction module protein [Cronbergia sp. UHCC 0137]MEA5620371.1 addiction module protein [Cronbergia sp. UHCC 0137]
MSLPSSSRVFLVEKLIESLESDIDENIQKVWNTEAKKRRDEIHNHTVEPISGEIALAQIRQILEISRSF